MTQVWEYIKIALMNIRSNKGRSILTMLGDGRKYGYYSITPAFMRVTGFILP